MARYALRRLLLILPTPFPAGPHLRAPWLALWPGVALSLSVFGANMLGDALRDLLDPGCAATVSSNR